MKSSLELGRFLEATRRINAGDVLFAEFPIIVGPRPDDVVCLGCYDPAPRDRCQKCFWPVCSNSCPGLTDPDHHGSECFILQLNNRKTKLAPENFFRLVKIRESFSEKASDGNVFVQVRGYFTPKMSSAAKKKSKKLENYFRNGESR